METGSACGKNVFGGRPLRDRCSIRRQNFRMAPLSRTFGSQPGSGKALNAQGMKTIGEIREASDAQMLSLPDLGKGSVAYLRQTLGPTSTTGLRPKGR